MNFISDYERAFEAPDITTEKMKGNIRRWFELYFNNDDDCGASAQRVPYVIVDGLSNACFGEYAYTVEEPEDNAAFSAAMENLDSRRVEAFQMALVGGEGFLKPIPKKDTFTFAFIRRDNYIVLARDLEGNITSVGTCEQFTYGKYFYTLLEKRTMDDRGYLTIEYKLFQSSTRSSIGSPVSLGSLPQYADLDPVTVFSVPVDSLGLVPIKTPITNCVDGSDDGVSIYAAAVAAIGEVYTHAKRTDNEYELTEPHLIVSADVQKRDSKGRLVEIPKYIEALIDEPANKGLSIYNPTPHQEQLEAREDQLLRHIEDICGLRRGILSHVDSEDKTATEVLTSSGRYALTIKSLQGMWQKTQDEAVRLLSVLGPLYGFWSEKVPAVTLTWGNGVLYDEEKEYTRLREAVNQGEIRAEYIPAWLFDEPLETDDDFDRVRDKYMPDMTGLETIRAVIG